MRYARIFIMLMIAFGISISGLKAEDQIPSPQEKKMLDMINHARTEKGLQPLFFNDRLYASVSSHSLDMIEKSYYSSTSPEGKTYQERMLENGYIPVISGEALGMLSFRNFVNPDNAVKVISDNMLADESDAERKQPLRILNPDVRDIGISFRAGVFKREGVSENVYVVVCDVGNNDTSLLDSALLKRINDTRNPVQAAGEAEKGALNLPAYQDSGSYHYLPNLQWNEKLYAAASKHNQDMIEHLYFDNISPSDTSPLDRILSMKYRAVSIIEYIVFVEVDAFFEPDRVESMLYEILLDSDIVLNKGMKDIGIDIRMIALNADEKKSLKGYIMVVELANDVSVFGPVVVEENYHKIYRYVENNLKKG